LEQCLERRKRYAWNREGVARAQYRYSQVLKRLGKDKEAESYGLEASKTRLVFLKKFSHLLKDDGDEEVVFDQMVSLFAGRLTGKLKDGTDKAVVSADS
jgi:hypothetical protein